MELSKINQLEKEMKKHPSFAKKVYALLDEHLKSTYELMMDYFNMGDYNRVLAMLNKALTNDPKNRDMIVFKFNTLMRAGKYDDARVWIKEHASMFSETSYQFGLGLIHYYLNENEEAITLLKGVDTVDAQIHLSRAYHKTNQYSACLSVLEKIEKHGPTCQSLYELGLVHGKLKNYEKAEEAYAKCAQEALIHPFSNEACLIKARLGVLWELKRYEDIIANCRRLIVLEPAQEWMMKDAMVKAYIKTGFHEAAYELSKYIMKHNPIHDQKCRHVEMLYHLGQYVEFEKCVMKLSPIPDTIQLMMIERGIKRIFKARTWCTFKATIKSMKLIEVSKKSPHKFHFDEAEIQIDKTMFRVNKAGKYLIEYERDGEIVKKAIQVLSDHARKRISESVVPSEKRVKVD
jgi:tetratricopeptide (TPR) repeat protein